MRTLPVILLQEKIKTVLLAPVRWLWWGILLKGSMHPFMTSVLAGLSRFDPLGADAQLNPPLRQFTDTADGQRSKGRSVVRANRLGQAILAKCPLQPGSDRLVAGMLQSPAQKQIARKVVAQRQRITAPMVAQSEISLEVCTPDLISSWAIAERFTIGRDMVMPNPAFDQSDPLENLTRCGIGGPDQSGPFSRK